MSNSMRGVLLSAAIAVSQLALPAEQVQAGPFLDWLFGRPILVYPAAPVVAPVPNAGVAVTTAYPPIAAATATCPTPCPMTTAMAPVTGSPCHVNAAMVQPTAVQPYVAGYAPTYQSTWYRVPTTCYRPVPAATVVAGQPMTVMQPCNSYTYQVRRVPLFGWLFGRPWLPPPVTAYYGSPYVAGYGSPYVAAYGSPYVAGYGQTVPAYGQPVAVFGQPTAGACNGCSTVATGMPYATTPSYGASMNTTTVPAGTIPNGNYSYPNSQRGGVTTEPADQAPALSPNGNIGTVPSVNNSYPTSSPNTSIGTVPDSAANRAPFSQGASSSRLSDIPPAPRNGANSASSVYQVKPIPDPEVNRNNNDSPRGGAPPLLDPRERHASLDAQQAKAVTPAVWRTTQKNSKPERDSGAPSKPAPAFWNDSGWRSAKSW